MIGFDQPVDISRIFVGIGARGAENRPPLVDDQFRLVWIQLDMVAGDGSTPAFLQSDGLTTLIMDRLNDGSYHRVQSGAVSAAGEYSDFHRSSLFEFR